MLYAGNELAYKREWIRQKRAANPEQYRQRERAYAATHKEQRNAAARARAAAQKAAGIDRKASWKLKNPDYSKNYALQRTLGISLKEKMAMIALQDNKCAICPKAFSEQQATKAHVDHCHETGKLRGILCNNCNRMLGLAYDNTNTLISAAAYLGMHGKR